MISLITVLISLLGYGSPTDYIGYTEAELNQEITEAQAALQEDGGGGDWDSPGVDSEGGGGDWDSPGVIENPDDENP